MLLGAESRKIILPRAERGGGHADMVRREWGGPGPPAVTRSAASSPAPLAPPLLVCQMSLCTGQSRGLLTPGHTRPVTKAGAPDTGPQSRLGPACASLARRAASAAPAARASPVGTAGGTGCPRALQGGAGRAGPTRGPSLRPAPRPSSASPSRPVAAAHHTSSERTPGSPCTSARGPEHPPQTRGAPALPPQTRGSPTLPSGPASPGRRSRLKCDPFGRLASLPPGLPPRSRDMTRP